MSSLTYTVVFEQEPDGGYVVSIPALPGCVSQGDTREGGLGEHPRGRRTLYRALPRTR